MIIAQLPPTEAARLEALRQYNILDTVSEQAFDDLTLIASQICGTPIALISLVDEQRQWFKSRVGLAAQETPRDMAFCAHAILEPDLFIVRNALEDERFATNPLVTGDPHVRFYAGAPLVTTAGDALGSLCVIDREPRELSSAQQEALQALSRQVMTQLELRMNAAQLTRTGEELNGEVAERRLAEERLRQAHDELERRVEERTAELVEANRSLEEQIAKREQVEQALRTSEERHRTLLKSLPQAVLYKDCESVFISANAVFAADRGLQPEDVVGKSDYDFFPQELADKYRADDQRVMTTRQAETIEEMSIARGQQRIVEVVKTPVISDDGRVMGVLGLVTDITERKQAERQLLHNAFHDTLTGLPNRALFMDRLGLAIERTKRHPEHLFAVLFIDLDGFKVINDSLGHLVGDKLLVGITQRLTATLRPGDTLARLGGDEFTMLLDDVADEESVKRVAERLHKIFAQPFDLDDQQVYATGSIGITLSTAAYDRPEELLRDADTAMYRAKQLGKDQHQVFDHSMHQHAVHRLQLETELRRAVELKEFKVHYQPIVSLEDAQIRGFEALVRWQHPERGLLMPGEFIQIAEDTGLILPIGWWVLAEACRQMWVWQQATPAGALRTMSVNLSNKQLMQSNLVDRVTTILRESGCNPRCLKLEITENAMIDNAEATMAKLEQLSELGVGISVDDFGTGYSSLGYIHRFPISTLKIDRSFVSHINSHKNAEIVRTIITLARNLGMEVVAEGVETGAQADQLKQLGCERGQGYLFSRPVPSADIEELLLLRMSEA